MSNTGCVLYLRIALRSTKQWSLASNKYRAEFIESFNSAPKKWKKAIRETIETNGLDSLIEL